MEIHIYFCNAHKENDLKRQSITYIFEKAFKFEHYMLFISKESEVYF